MELRVYPVEGVEWHAKFGFSVVHWHMEIGLRDLFRDCWSNTGKRYNEGLNCGKDSEDGGMY